MRRRSALAALAAAGTTVIAGCSLDREQIHGDPATAAPVTDSARTTDTETGTPPASTPLPGNVPSDRVVDGEAVSEDGLGVTADRWFALEEVRYENDDGEQQTVTSDRGWFVAYEFTLRNHGDSRTDSLPDSVFELRVDGESYAHIHEFPDGVQFSALDQPSSEPQIRELAWYNGLDPDAAVSLQLVYEAPVQPDYRHYLAWDPDSSVEGASDPVYLTGRRVLPDAD